VDGVCVVAVLVYTTVSTPASFSLVVVSWAPLVVQCKAGLKLKELKRILTNGTHVAQAIRKLRKSMNHPLSSSPISVVITPSTESRRTIHKDVANSGGNNGTTGSACICRTAIQIDVLGSMTAYKCLIVSGSDISSAVVTPRRDRHR